MLDGHCQDGYPELKLNRPKQQKQNNIIKIYKKVHWLQKSPNGGYCLQNMEHVSKREHGNRIA